MTWEIVKTDKNKKGALLLYSINNEQGFCMEMSGCPRRKIYDLDGVQLVYVSNRETTVEPMQHHLVSFLNNSIYREVIDGINKYVFRFTGITTDADME